MKKSTKVHTNEVDFNYEQFHAYKAIPQQGVTFENIIELYKAMRVPNTARVIYFDDKGVVRVEYGGNNMVVVAFDQGLFGPHAFEQRDDGERVIFVDAAMPSSLELMLGGVEVEIFEFSKVLKNTAVKPRGRFECNAYLGRREDE